MAKGYQSSRLLKIQKKAMIIVSISKFNYRLRHFSKKVNIKITDDILNLRELNFYFKYVHHDLPAYL